MKITITSLIIGLILGAILIFFTYYIAYKAFESYQVVRHPFGGGKKGSQALSPLQFSGDSQVSGEYYPSEYSPQESLKMVGLGKWLNSPEAFGGDEYISSGITFIRINDGRSLALDESLQNLIIKKFNLTDEYQKWFLYFYGNPNNPFENKQGIIYNIKYNKYISFEGYNIILKKFKKPVDLKYPVGNFNVECMQSSDNILNLEGNLYMSLKNNLFELTPDKSLAVNFLISKQEFY